MSATALKHEPLVLGPECNGMHLTPGEFDRADFEEGWRYELINTVLIVSPIAAASEVGPNEYLGHLLLTYQETHPSGACLDLTLPERTVRTGRNRRRADRCIWAGLGRLPKKNERPTIAVEFVSSRKRDRERDYQIKRAEYKRIKVKEYWVVDRFDRCMVVFTFQNGKTKKHVVGENEVYATPLLRGFKLPLAKLLARADALAKQDEEEPETQP